MLVLVRQLETGQRVTHLFSITQAFTKSYETSGKLHAEQEEMHDYLERRQLHALLSGALNEKKKFRHFVMWKKPLRWLDIDMEEALKDGHKKVPLRTDIPPFFLPSRALLLDCFDPSHAYFVTVMQCCSA